MSNSHIKLLAEEAIIAAIAMALSYLPLDIAWYQISLGCLPIAILSIRRGQLAGLTSGFIWGLLHLLLGKIYFLSVIQFTMEYFLAFMLMGLAGLTSHSFQAQLKAGKSPYMTYSLGALLGCFAKYLIHFIAGFIYWGQYAPKHMSPVIYSLSVNGSSFIMTSLTVIVIGIILIKTYPKLFQVQP